MLALLGASKQYGPLAALQPLTLDFPAGTVTAVIGPSGCGKSTLLRLLLGLIEPDRGRVEIEGVPLTADKKLAWRRRIGYMTQDGGLFPHLTARENVALMARHLRRPAHEITQRLRELCALTKFPAEALDRYPGELSGGQRQRVGLMRALMLSPAVLLMDEPLAALDPLIRRGLQDDLKEIFTALKPTVILVTHDLPEAAHLADRIALLRDGRLVQCGTLAALRDHPAEPFVSEFFAAQRPAVAV